MYIELIVKDYDYINRNRTIFFIIISLFLIPLFFLFYPFLPPPKLATIARYMGHFVTFMIFYGRKGKKEDRSNVEDFSK